MLERILEQRRKIMLASALDNPIRKKILKMLPTTPKEVSEILNIDISVAKQHITILTRVGIIKNHEV